MGKLFDKVAFGKIIYDLRVARKFGQKDVANACGVSYKQVSALERGFRAPSVEVLLALADFFYVTVDYLVGRNDKI